MTDSATGPIGLCVTGCPTLWTVRLPHRYLHPQSWGWAGGGDGRGWRGRSGWGCPAPGRCCIWVGDLGEMRQTTKTENKEKKKDGEGGKNKNKQSVWHTLERESSLASMRQGSGKGGRGGRVRSTDSSVSAGNWLRASWSRAGVQIYCTRLWSARQMDLCQMLTQTVTGAVARTLGILRSWVPPYAPTPPLKYHTGLNIR